MPEAYQDPLRFEEACRVIVGRACRCIHVQEYFPILPIISLIKCNMTLAWKGNDVDDDDDDDDDDDVDVDVDRR